MDDAVGDEMMAMDEAGAMEEMMEMEDCGDKEMEDAGNDAGYCAFESKEKCLRAFKRCMIITILILLSVLTYKDWGFKNPATIAIQETNKEMLTYMLIWFAAFLMFLAYTKLTGN